MAPTEPLRMVTKEEERQWWVHPRHCPFNLKEEGLFQMLLEAGSLLPISIIPGLYTRDVRPSALRASPDVRAHRLVVLMGFSPLRHCCAILLKTHALCFCSLLGMLISLQHLKEPRKLKG